MKIIIVGAGLGGLSAAVCFSKQGHQVQVLERNEDLSPRGGGINVRPGATRILQSWGLGPEMDAISTESGTMLFRSLRTGDIVQRKVLVEASSHPDWGTTRVELINMFYNVAKKLCDIRFGTAIADVHDDPSEQPCVQLEDGTHMYADMIIAADGISSRLRPKILGDITTTTSPIVSDHTFYGLKIPVSKLDASSSRLFDQTNINIWVGQDIFVISRYYPKLEEVGLLYSIKSKTDQNSLWDDRGDIDYVREQFQGSCTELETALRIGEKCDRWKVVEMPNLPRWTSKTGRIVLLGDSAHGMHPNAAQGYSQIVEDIAVLGFLAKEPRSVPWITSAWQDIRKPRVERIKDFANWNTRIFTGETRTHKPRNSETSKSERAKITSLKHVKPDMNASFTSSEFYKWVMDYDAVEEVLSAKVRRFAKC